MRAEMLDDPFAIVGTRLEGRYDIEAMVAQGGFGVVYRGCHRAIDRAIALKVLKVPDTLSDAMQAAFIAGFVREAKLLVKVDHPAVVRVLDFGVMSAPDGRDAPWMALEWVEGVNLSDWLAARRGRGGMSPADALGLLLPIGEALIEAHGLGVVHRDLKPSNIRVTLDTKDPAPLGDPARVTAVRLLDFGIAKEMDVDERVGSGVTSTASALLAFSLAYAAPEQVSAARTGPWTDVHGLALILSEMLTDAAPFRGVDRMEIQLQVMSPERPTPAREGVDVGPLEPVLAKALKLRPAERYATVAEFLAAVTAAAQGTVSRPRRSRATAKRLPTFPASFPVWSDEEPATLPLTGLTAPPIPPTEPVVAEQTVAAPPPARRPRSTRALVAVAVVAMLATVATTVAMLRSAPAPPATRDARALVVAPRLVTILDAGANAPPPTTAVGSAPPRATAPSVRDERAAAAPRLRRQVTRRLQTRQQEPPTPAPRGAPLRSATPRERGDDLHDPWQ